MKITRLDIPQVLLIEPTRHADDRGYFSEIWKRSALVAAGITADFVQDNHSLSRAAGTLRGLHYQRAPSAQSKLVRVTRGSIFDVAVDIRPHSPTYGRHVTAMLSAENGLQLWIPQGFAHGFMTLTPETEVTYKVDAEYDPAADAAIAWNDPDLAIRWPLAPGGPILSPKDQAAPRFRHAAPIDLPVAA